LLLALGLTLFSLAESGSGSVYLPGRAELLGTLMLTGSVCCDAVCPNLQERLLRRFAQPRSRVVMRANALSAVLTASAWLGSGEAALARAYLHARPAKARLLLLQSLAGYAGVLAYLGCIRHAGSKATVLVTTARKLFTIAMSYVLFMNHAFTLSHGLGLVMAVVGMAGSALQEMRPDPAAAAAAAGGGGGGKGESLSPAPSTDACKGSRVIYSSGSTLTLSWLGAGGSGRLRAERISGAAAAPAAADATSYDYSALPAEGDGREGGLQSSRASGGMRGTSPPTPPRCRGGDTELGGVLQPRVMRSLSQ